MMLGIITRPSSSKKDSTKRGIITRTISGKEAYLKHSGDDILGLHLLDVSPAGPDVSQENLRYTLEACLIIEIGTSVPSSSVASGSVSKLMSTLPAIA